MSIPGLSASGRCGDYPQTRGGEGQEVPTLQRDQGRGDLNGLVIHHCSKRYLSFRSHSSIGVLPSSDAFQTFELFECCPRCCRPSVAPLPPSCPLTPPSPLPITSGSSLRGTRHRYTRSDYTTHIILCLHIPHKKRIRLIDTPSPSLYRISPPSLPLSLSMPHSPACPPLP